MTRRFEEADRALRCVMQAHGALFWEEKDDGRIFIDKPKRPKPRRGGETYDHREVDLQKLETIRNRLKYHEPLQDFECLECLVDRAQHRR